MPEHVIDLMAVVPGMTLVDLGAGTGFFSKPLSEAAGPQGRVLALDPEENLVAFMNERAAREGLSNVEARVIPHDDPQLEDGSVDRILIVNTWHHISDRAEYSTKLLRALKAGGQIFIVDFEMDSPSGPPRQHRLEPEEILQDLRGGGLEARQMGDELPRQYVIVGSKGEG